jgi:WD repeat-containing protein 61
MQVHLYEATGNLIEAFSGHESWVLDVAVHPDGGHFLSSSSDSSVKLWDISQRTCVATVREHSDQVWGVALSPDGTKAASCGDDGKVVTYSLQ